MGGGRGLVVVKRVGVNIERKDVIIDKSNNASESDFSSVYGSSFTRSHFPFPSFSFNRRAPGG